MRRRDLLAAGAVMPPPPMTPSVWSAQGATAPKTVEALQQHWQELAPSGFHAPAPTEKLELSADEWHGRLAPAQFDVLRRAGTEHPFSSPLDGEKRAGIYTCAAC